MLAGVPKIRTMLQRNMSKTSEQRDETEPTFNSPRKTPC